MPMLRDLNVRWYAWADVPYDSAVERGGWNSAEDRDFLGFSWRGQWKEIDVKDNDDFSRKSAD